MAEYIKREDVLRHRRKMSGTDFGGEFWDEAVLCEDIRKIPTADVVEVVMCKDCKHYKPYTKPVEDFDGECIVRECETDENEFCSYGTPKERGEEK